MRPVSRGLPAGSSFAESRCQRRSRKSVVPMLIQAVALTLLLSGAALVF